MYFFYIHYSKNRFLLFLMSLSSILEARAGRSDYRGRDVEDRRTGQEADRRQGTSGQEADRRQGTSGTFDNFSPPGRYLYYCMSKKS